MLQETGIDLAVDGVVGTEDIDQPAWMPSTSEAPEPETSGTRPPGADLPSGHGVTAHGALPFPFSPDRIHAAAGFLGNACIWHR